MKRDALDRLLLLQIAIVSAVTAQRRRAVDAVRRALVDRRGQTPTEYLMIVGLMAVVIVTVFVFYYWSNVKEVAQNWVTNVKESVSGTKIDQ